MSGRGLGTWIVRAFLAVVAAAGLVLSMSLERGTVERGNRLHRFGSRAEAAAVYTARIRSTSADAELHYNLGTALLESGGADATRELDVAAELGGAEVQARAHYNAGLANLRRAIEGVEGDSLRALAQAAVQSNRSALRLRPGHEDTSWNLALAQRLLDSIDAADRPGEETAESALEADEVVQSENVLEVDDESELPEDAPMEGEDETGAEDEDEEVMTLMEAAGILSDSHLDPTLLVRKLLALESRSFLGRRFRAAGPRR